MAEDLLDRSEDKEFIDEDIDDSQVGEAALRVLGIDKSGDDSNYIDKFNHEVELRTEIALQNCEFEATHEIKEAIKSFYKEHLALLEAIKAIIDGKYDSDIFKIIEKTEGYEEWEIRLSSNYFYERDGQTRPEVAPNVKVYSLRLANCIKNLKNNNQEISKLDRQKLLQLAGRALTGLFSESSVGISTITDNEIMPVAKLADDLIREAGTDYMFYFTPSNSQKFITGKEAELIIRSAEEEFWRDVRHAGSLVFHGSSDLGSVNVHGLMSRNQQLRELGNMNNATRLNTGKTMHSVVPHFSEFYGLGQYSGANKGGTLAIPLIKIIKQAPYARDAQYGVAKMKETGSHEIPVPVLSRPVGDSGGGDNDAISAQGIDRVFFASPDEQSDKLPDEYKIIMHDKTNLPATYIILREPKINTDRELVNLGIGFGMPERLIIECPNDSGGEHSPKGDLLQKSLAEQKIIELQNKYLEAYSKEGIVVPLRRGVFAQVLENLPVDYAKGRPMATIYNKYVEGSGKSI